MLSCFPVSRGHSLRTPGMESACQRLRRRLTPSRRRRPHCSSHPTVTDAPGKASRGLTASDPAESSCLFEVSLSPNPNGTQTAKSPGQDSPGPGTSGDSGQVSPQLGTKNLDSERRARWDTEVPSTRPRETPRSLVDIRPGLATTAGNGFTGSRAEVRPVWSVWAARPPSLTKPFALVFLGGQPYSGPFFPSTSTTHTSARLVLMLGRDATARFETSTCSEGLCDEDKDIRCSDNKQRFTTKWGKEEDLCTTPPRLALEESFRHFERDEDSEPLIRASRHVPEPPKMPCPAQKSIHRRGAGLWRKLRRANGHTFQTSRFSKRAHCAVCADRVGGLGRQVNRCLHCKLSVHKKCHTLLTTECGQRSSPPEPLMPTDPSSTAGTPAETVIPCGLEHVDEESRAVTSRESGKPSSSLGLRDFDLLRVIGRGSYSKVLLVQLRKTDRIYAMKVVKKELVNIDRVQTEKHVLEEVSGYPFLVGLHSCFQTESRLFFVLDYVSGGDLMFHMQQRRRLPEEHARFYSAEISLALNYLHKRGILYRNSKLDNLLLDSEGHIKLTDYCVCKEGLQPGDRTSTFCGTPNYLAPEVIRGEDYGFPVDWWSLGVLMFEMMVGESPFHIVERSDNRDQNSINYLLQVILERKIHIPRYLSVKAASVLKGFLKKDPKERLGCHPQTGFADIQEHPFFQNVDWDRIEQKQVVLPFKPNISGELGLDNFDFQFTTEPVQFTPDDNDIVRRIDGCEFAGFEYINHLSMYEEWV